LGAAPSPQSLARRSGAIITTASSLRIPRRETPSIPARRPAASALASRRSVYAAVWALRPLAAVHGFVNLVQPAFIRRPVSTPAPRPSPPGLPGADSTVALAAAGFISFTAPEFPTSARLSRPALLAAAVCMGLAGPQESTSARLPPQVLRASGVSMPAAGWDPHTSAGQPRQVLPAEGFMALEA